MKAGTATPIVDKLHKAVLAAADMPTFRARAWQIGSNIVTSKTPFVFQQFNDAELERWTQVNNEAGINP